MTTAPARTAEWSSVALGAVALAGSVAAYGVRHARRQDWQDLVVGTRCRTVPPLPDVTALNWLGIASSVVAIVAFAYYCRVVVRARGTSLRVVIGAMLAVVAVGCLAVGLLFATTTPTDAHDGLDGSGLPCASG
ncbi:hypothetical protein F3087_36685 [Nocardia colli]|uniref:Uncharacterized protein n=1 Tax=Nocardia colli TaxID=2545717 RepID=A0A5N0E6Q7_9NOCA|nr:hypothetical protein [Nocardia colli]KAA8883804.1 hypothetical protein F3087_36685 [Nocardia colli]